MISTRAVASGYPRGRDRVARRVAALSPGRERHKCLDPELSLPLIWKTIAVPSRAHQDDERCGPCAYRTRDVKQRRELLQHNVTAPFDCRETADVIDASRRPVRFLPSTYRRQTACSSYARVQRKLSNSTFAARRFVSGRSDRLMAAIR